MMHRAFILLGSNIGDRQTNLGRARTAIRTLVGSIDNESSLYSTPAWGNTDDPSFLNQALEVSTSLTPHELLRVLLEIEMDMGRIRTKKWAPRIIDLDIAFYDDEQIIESDLVVPHPRLPERNFALVPLVEIAPQLMHPVLQKTLKQLLDASPDDSEVTILEGR